MIQRGDVVGSTEKTDDIAVVADRNAEDNTGFVVKTALDRIAQNAVAGDALLKVFTVGDIFHFSGFIMGCTVRFDERYMIDGGRGLDGGQHVPVLFGDEDAVGTDLRSNTVQKLVVDIQDIFEMGTLPGDIQSQFCLGQFIYSTL